jgi:hypothetical protein
MPARARRHVRFQVGCLRWGSGAKADTARFSFYLWLIGKCSATRTVRDPKDCKTVGSAYVGSNPTPATPRGTAPDLGGPG